MVDTNLSIATHACRPHLHQRHDLPRFYPPVMIWKSGFYPTFDLPQKPYQAGVESRTFAVVSLPENLAYTFATTTATCSGGSQVRISLPLQTQSRPLGSSG